MKNEVKNIRKQIRNFRKTQLPKNSKTIMITSFKIINSIIKKLKQRILKYKNFLKPKKPKKQKKNKKKINYIRPKNN